MYIGRGRGRGRRRRSSGGGGIVVVVVIVLVIVESDKVIIGCWLVEFVREGFDGVRID